MNGRILVFFLLSFLILAGCSQKPVKVATVVPVSNGHYDSRFPSNDASDELEAITRSVCKVYSVATYKTYYFKEGMAVTRADLASGSYLYKLFGITTTTETTSGTATVIYHAFGRIAMISCAHVLVSPDTLITYYQALKDEPEQFINSVSIKDKQESFVREAGACGSMDILAIDRKSDVAIIGKECNTAGDPAPAFGYPVGNTLGLGWGTFVYIIGYPLGTLMITKGIVSRPKAGGSGSFLVDAVFNKGFSGGIILALKNGVPNFELVGMIRSVPSQKEYFIKPEKEAYDAAYDENATYKGELYVGKHEAISYGVTAVVPVEQISELYKNNRSALISSGFNLDGFFNPDAGK
jgi:hypothetical protein